MAFHGLLYFPFAGNQCRAILRNIKNLEIPVELNHFENFLVALHKLYITCNQQFMSHNPKIIDMFRMSWYKLQEKTGISTTPKIHIILDHVEDYFNDVGLTLFKVTDEMVESCHQYLHKRFMKSYFITKDLSNSSHGDRLYRAVRHHNSSAISM